MVNNAQVCYTNAVANVARTKAPHSSRPLVATAHTPAGLRQAAELAASEVGFVEIRLDTLAGAARDLAGAVSAIRSPLLFTARHPAEGGAGRLSPSKRRDLLEAFLPAARALDVELRSAGAMADLLERARRRRVTRVVSFHDFRGTPGLPRLRDVVRRSCRTGADIVKIATLLRGPRDLAVLLMLQGTARVPLATMGMGPLGKVSRLVLAAAGSRLNYGYLDKPQVAGQWPARELALRLGEVLP